MSTFQPYFGVNFEGANIIKYTEHGPLVFAEHRGLRYNGMGEAAMVRSEDAFQAMTDSLHEAGHESLERHTLQMNMRQTCGGVLVPSRDDDGDELSTESLNLRRRRDRGDDVEAKAVLTEVGTRVWRPGMSKRTYRQAIRQEVEASGEDRPFLAMLLKYLPMILDMLFKMFTSGAV